jgi:hypothetical protein
MIIFVQSKEYSQSTLIMKEIVLKDKVITLTKENLEVKRLPGKWFQSYFEAFLIKGVLAVSISLAAFILLLMIGLTLETHHFMGFLGGGATVITLNFLSYYRNRTIPLNNIQVIDIKRNQLWIVYKYKNSKLNLLLNLPMNEFERDRALSELQREGFIINDIPELPQGSEKRMHKGNLYYGLTGIAISSVLYFVIFNNSSLKLALVLSLFILLFSISTILFSSARLLEIKKTAQ